MWRIKRILHIHIILIYFTFIYSQNHYYHSSCRYTRVLATSQQEATNPNDSIRTSTTETESTIATSTDDRPAHNGDDMSPENIKLVKERYKEMAKEMIFNLKGKPTQTVPEKAFVPRAMLEEYFKMRESVREVIPDDRDFFGKIDIDGTIETHEDIWSAVRNKYGSHDIRVDMGPTNTETINYRFKGEASHIGHLPVSETHDVPLNIQPILPPHARDKRSLKQFQSVHLKFNLSQSATYQTAEAVDDLRGAELYLSREKLYDCLFHQCSDKRLVPFSSTSNSSSSIGISSISDSADLQENNPQQETARYIVPRYQRIYILRIYGYDQFDEPKTQIFESKLIKTDETTPIVFNVYPIIKAWMMNPKSNYGIIIRVTNDDQGYVQSSHTKEQTIPEHVRLKRQFRLKSESDKDWEQNQPYILVYSKISESTRRHVKRHHEQDTDQMQADNPSTSTIDPINKRDHIPSQPRRASHNWSGAGTRPKQKKSKLGCRKKAMPIDFDEVGWSNWIIAPKSYNAYVCSGECGYPFADTQNATNHAIIQAIYYNAAKNLPKACCAPVKLAKMAILYQLDGVVQMREYDDMIVEACGCL